MLGNTYYPIDILSQLLKNGYRTSYSRSEGELGCEPVQGGLLALLLFKLGTEVLNNCTASSSRWSACSRYSSLFLFILFIKFMLLYEIFKIAINISDFILIM